MLADDFIEKYATDTGRHSLGYTVHLVPIAAIMSTMDSCDSDYDLRGDHEESWRAVFERKRDDEHYESLRDSLETNGFLTPLCIQVDELECVESFHNGNHRLAAAVELGFHEVPVVFVEHYGEDRWNATQLDQNSGWEYMDDDERSGLLASVDREPFLALAT